MSHPFAESKMLTFSDLNTIGGPTREIARNITSNQSLEWPIVNEELNISNQSLVLDAIHRSTTIKALIFWSLSPMDVGIRVDQMRKLEHLYFNDSEIAGVSDTLTTICPLNLSLQEEFDFYHERNKQANPILNANLPLSIWPRVLKRADVCRHGGDHLRGPDMLYYFVKEKCELFIRGPSRRKRKRTDG